MNIQNLWEILEYFQDDEEEFLKLNMFENGIEEELPHDLEGKISFMEENDLINSMAYNLAVLNRDLNNL